MVSTGLKLALLCALLYNKASSDMVFKFGYNPAKEKIPACYTRNFQDELTASFTCKVKSWEFVSGVEVRLNGSPIVKGGASLKNKLGQKNVTVSVWSSQNDTLDYEIYVYSDHAREEHPSPFVLNDTVKAKNHKYL